MTNTEFIFITPKSTLLPGFLSLMNETTIYLVTQAKNLVVILDPSFSLIPHI